MSQGANNGWNLPIRVIAFDFVYSIKTRPRFNSHSKVTQDLRHYYMLNGHLRSVLLPNKVKMNTFTNNLPFVEDKETPPRFLESPVFFHLFSPWETTWHSAFVPSVPKRVQRWRVSWIRFIKKIIFDTDSLCLSRSHITLKKIDYVICRERTTKTTFSKNFQCYCQIKFVLWRCAFCKLRRNFGFFCSVNHLSGPLRKHMFTWTSYIGHGLWLMDFNPFGLFPCFKVLWLWSFCFWL